MTKVGWDVPFSVLAAVIAAGAGAVGLTPHALFGAYAGVFLSVFVLNRQDVALLTRVAPGGRAARGFWVAGAVSGYAIGSAWVVALAIHWWPGLAGAPEVPTYGLGGLSSLLLLPRLSRAVRKRADRLGDPK